MAEREPGQVAGRTKGQNALTAWMWARAAPAAQQPLTSPLPDSLLLKAVAAFGQESLVEAWTGRAAKGGRQNQDSKEGNQAAKTSTGAADTSPSPLTAPRPPTCY